LLLQINRCYDKDVRFYLRRLNAAGISFENYLKMQKLNMKCLLFDRYRLQTKKNAKLPKCQKSCFMHHKIAALHAKSATNTYKQNNNLNKSTKKVK